MQGVRSTKLPAISPEKESELVMSYGPNLKEAMRRTARYVDKIRFVTARAILFSIVLGVSAISQRARLPEVWQESAFSILKAHRHQLKMGSARRLRSWAT